jgi:hypothetical protein
MAIELSNLTFTEQDDIVPASGVEPILNTGIANTLAGNDQITGIWTIISDFYSDAPPQYSLGGISGFYNTGTLNTADGNDQITGIIQNPDLEGYFDAAIYNEGGTIDTGDGDDIIIGSHNENVDSKYIYGYGIYNIGTIDTGDGNDIITGITKGVVGLVVNNIGTIDTGNGNDTITGIASTDGIGLQIFNYGNLDTGDGNDIITGEGAAGIQNSSTITTSNGNDIITGTGTFAEGILNIGDNLNSIGVINTGGGDDIITGTSTDNYGIENNSQLSIIDTGDGNDVITAISGLGIYNQGTINTGDGNDSIIANGGFASPYTKRNGVVLGNTGRVFLGNGKDYIKGFGSGEFSGGNGNDTLELTPGTYTVGRWYTAVTFTKGDQLMIISEFEQLIAGSTTYDFSSLTKGQTITVA